MIQVIACCISMPGGFISKYLCDDKPFTPTLVYTATTITGFIFHATRLKPPDLHGNAEWKLMKILHIRAAAKVTKKHSLELQKTCM